MTKETNITKFRENQVQLTANNPCRTLMQFIPLTNTLVQQPIAC